MKYSKLFITGCDAKTRWMLPWFQDRFHAHNPDALLKVYDFDKFYPEAKGWFKKPAAMMDAAKLAQYVCWIDTDCEILGSLDKIWDHIEPNKLSMVQDHPWSKRRGETWHNSGVVAFQSYPNILSEWKTAVDQSPQTGDQEVLHSLLDPMRRMVHIADLPHRYNVLRLDHIDNNIPWTPVIHHWTGMKGKEKIRSMMNG
jgi:hypothetical protein